MRSFTSTQLDAEKISRVNYIKQLINDDPEVELLHLKPPKSNGGKETVENLMKNVFHTYNEEQTFFKRYNTSPVCGFEIWYDAGKIDFYWYTPSKKQNKRYSRQLHNRYPDGELNASLEKFVPVEQDEYFAGCEYHLKHHYFEPINHKGAFDFNNIYEDLLSEIDTKDESRVIIQVLYKAAEDDWTELHSLTVDDMADNLDKDMQTESKWFGLVSKERPLSAQEKKIPNMIRKQRDKLGYYINFRIGVLAPTAEEAEREMAEIDDIIDYTFETPSGQNFVPERCSENELGELLEDIVSRRPQKMYQPKLPRDYFKHKQSSTYEHIIVTAAELASLAHIPNTREVDIGGINWSLTSADGSLPPGAKDFKRATEDEKKTTLEDLQRHSNLDGRDDAEQLSETAETEEEDTGSLPDRA